MQEYRKTFASIGFALVATAFMVLAPPLEITASAFSCCEVGGLGDKGCWDSYADECRADGECHSEDPKSCNVDFLNNCRWINDGGCSA